MGHNGFIVQCGTASQKSLHCIALRYHYITMGRNGFVMQQNFVHSELPLSQPKNGDAPDRTF